MTQDLVFEAPRRGKPPRHLADLDLSERRAAVVAAASRPTAPTRSPATTSGVLSPTRPR